MFNISIPKKAKPEYNLNVLVLSKFNKEDFEPTIIEPDKVKVNLQNILPDEEKSKKYTIDIY